MTISVLFTESSRQMYPERFPSKPLRITARIATWIAIALLFGFMGWIATNSGVK